MMQCHAWKTLTMPTVIDDLADTTRTALEALGLPLVETFLADWPRLRHSRPVTPKALPVLRHLTTIAAAPPRVASALVTDFLRSAAGLTWHQTYSAQELDRAFLDNYGYTELLGAIGPRCSDRLAAGFLLLGPNTFYPRHRHPAEELYLPLSGTAEWQQGDTVWRGQEPGTLIHHRSDEPHAMRTAAEPLLALYLWRGADLAQKARLSD
jgi:hypothetical protein